MTNPQHVFRFLNPLLALLAAFTVAWTLYISCRFPTWLPTSDTWIYVDFLAEAARGHLDIPALLERHNSVHIIALPKLAYFLDMWLVGGSGVIVTAVSLLAMVVTAALFIFILFRHPDLSAPEKFFFSCLSVILLLSACQAESLLNPANLQWSLLVFTATLTAFFFHCYRQQNRQGSFSPMQRVKTASGMILGIVLTGLTSASSLLVVIPLVILLLPTPWLRRLSMGLVALLLLALVVCALFFSSHLPLAFGALRNWGLFMADFIVPPMERLHNNGLTVLAAASVLLLLVKARRSLFDNHHAFFAALLVFALLVMAATGLLRVYTTDAFTFRFVNIGLLFAAALFPLLWLYRGHRLLVTTAMLLYVSVLAYVNVTEASAFAYGRNHVRLAQVAHALNIEDSFVVSALPGTVWEQRDYETVQANKHKLQAVNAGVYSSEAYGRTGKSMDDVPKAGITDCRTEIIKARRLLPDKAYYKFQGISLDSSGGGFSRAYFVDGSNVIRGFAIPLVSQPNLLEDIAEDKQWGGFVNLEGLPAQHSIAVQAYDGHRFCKAEVLDLPEYSAPKKKTGRTGQPLAE